MDRQKQLEAVEKKIRLLVSELYSHLNIRKSIDHAVNDVPHLSLVESDNLFEDILGGLLEIELTPEAHEFCQNNRQNNQQGNYA
jgi:hypothetical protein